MKCFLLKTLFLASLFLLSEPRRLKTEETIIINYKKNRNNVPTLGGRLYEHNRLGIFTLIDIKDYLVNSNSDIFKGVTIEALINICNSNFEKQKIVKLVTRSDEISLSIEVSNCAPHIKTSLLTQYLNDFNERQRICPVTAILAYNLISVLTKAFDKD